jgi:hypothetical protein
VHKKTVVLLLALLCVAAAAASGCGSAAGPATGTLDDPEAFEDFPLYDLGDEFEGAPLEAARSRPGFVEFAYGSEPRVLVQVWPACVRNPLLRPEVLLEGHRLERELMLRGARAYVFEGGRRLEVATREATVVIRAADLREARRAARALEGVNNPLERGDQLPPADAVEVSASCAANDQEATGVAAALEDALAADGQPAPTIVACGRSLAVERTDEVDDAHECVGFFDPHNGLAWCVLSAEETVLAGTIAGSCEAAAGGVDRKPLAEPATLGWGVQAEAACQKWLAAVPGVLASLDQERVQTDLSYVWEVMRLWEVDVIAELRALPSASAEVEELLALYEARAAEIDAAVAEYHAGGTEDALARLQGVEDETPELVARFEAVGAGACAPHW